jgi:hypothetical protein
MEAAVVFFRNIFGEDISDVLARLSGSTGQVAAIMGQVLGGAGNAALATGKMIWQSGQAASEASTYIFRIDRNVLSICHRRKNKCD